MFITALVAMIATVPIIKHIFFCILFAFLDATELQKIVKRNARHLKDFKTSKEFDSIQSFDHNCAFHCATERSKAWVADPVGFGFF